MSRSIVPIVPKKSYLRRAPLALSDKYNAISWYISNVLNTAACKMYILTEYQNSYYNVKSRPHKNNDEWLKVAVKRTSFR